MNWSKFGTLNILIIDDDQFTRELVKTMLKPIPTLTVHQAKDGVNALLMLETNRYDMFILDLYMPNMSGEEFIKRIKVKNEIHSSSPIVLITTDRLSSTRLKSMEVNYYLTKPFDFNNFLNNIYEFLEKEQLFK